MKAVPLRFPVIPASSLAVTVSSASSALVGAEPAKKQPVYTNLPIRINNPRNLGAWQIPAERIVLGEAYKPSMALLPSGELVMVALYQDRLPNNKVREWTGFWRSQDDGRSWTERVEIKDMIGREQWLTATKDGTLFATCHLLAQDINN